MDRSRMNVFFLDWGGLGGGRIGDRSLDGIGERGDEGSKYRWLYDRCCVRIVITVFVVILPTPGLGATHPVVFVAN